jgi:uncharacterized protein YaaN involved in tellurite resistance
VNEIIQPAVIVSSLLAVIGVMFKILWGFFRKEQRKVDHSIDAISTKLEEQESKLTEQINGIKVMMAENRVDKGDIKDLEKSVWKLSSQMEAVFRYIDSPRRGTDVEK